MKNLSAKNVYVIGDTHSLDYCSILQHYNLSDFILIHLGDSGEGFGRQSYDNFFINRLQSFCQENNGIILTVRGNHSNPKFYNDPNHWTKAYDLVNFIPDYTYFNINGKVVLFVGGAISIDRKSRSEGFDYWKDEVFVLRDDYEKLDQCDILITHSAPLSCPPNDGFARIKGWFVDDPTLKDELIKERQDIEKLYNHVNCSQLYYGHYHITASLYDNGCFNRAVNINEIVDITWNF